MLKRLFCIILIFVLLSSFFVIGFAKDEVSPNNVLVYDIPQQVFWNFTTKQDVSVFKKCTRSIDTLSYNQDTKNIVDYQLKNGKSLLFHNDGFLMVNDFDIYKNFIDFFSSFSNIEMYLAQHGIHATVQNIFIFTVDYGTLFSADFKIPITACIETSVGNYMITIDEENISSKNWNDSNLQGDYVFTLFSMQDFINKYELKDGKVIANNHIINKNVKFSTECAYVPMRDILQDLGCQVNWNNKKREVFIIKNDKTLIIQLMKDNRFQILDSKQNIINPGIPYVYNIVDGKMILYFNTMYSIAYVFWGKDIDADISTNNFTANFSLNQK